MHQAKFFPQNCKKCCMSDKMSWFPVIRSFLWLLQLFQEAEIKTFLHSSDDGKMSTFNSSDFLAMSILSVEWLVTNYSEGQVTIDRRRLKADRESTLMQTLENSTFKNHLLMVVSNRFNHFKGHTVLPLRYISYQYVCATYKITCATCRNLVELGNLWPYSRPHWGSMCTWEECSEFPFLLKCW